MFEWSKNKELRNIEVKSFRIIEARTVVFCSNCQGEIQIGEKYLRLKFKIGKILEFKPLFFHFSSQDCDQIKKERRKTEKADAEIKLLVMNERKVDIARNCSSKYIFTDHAKTYEWFHRGYKLETVCKDEKTAFAEAELLHKRAKLTKIAFFDDWFEVWAKTIWRRPTIEEEETPPISEKTEN